MHLPVGVRSFGRHVVRGDQPGANTSPEPTSTQATSSDASTYHLSVSVRPLIGSLVVIGVIIFGIVAWKMYSYRKRKNRAACATRFSIVYRSSEKPAFVSFAGSDIVNEYRKPVLTPSISSDPYARWVPQIRSVTLPSGVTVPPIAVTAPDRSPTLQDERPPTPNSGPLVPQVPSPPPAYHILGLHSIPVPPSPPESAPIDIPPPTPMHKSPGTTVSAPTRESFDLPPVPSPRSESFQSTTSTTSPSRIALATAFAPKSFPQLMLVTSSFQPARPDELSLRMGETLRLIREFEDEWCLVQRVGRPNAEKGVVPRFCLEERPRIIKNRATVAGFAINGARRK
jgi:hypothetical protein